MPSKFNPNSRSHLLPHGLKNLGEAPKAKSAPKAKTDPPLKVRVNGHIRVGRLDLRNEEGKRIGISNLPDALNLARSQNKDLVQIDHLGKVPICLLIDFGLFRYQTSHGRLLKKWLRQLPPVA